MTSRIARANVPSLIVIGRLGVTLSALVSAPIVARALGPDGRGESAAAIAIFYMLPVALGLGVPLQVRRQCSRHPGQNVLRSSRTFCLLAMGVSLPTAWLLYSTLFANFDPTARLVASVGAAISPLSVSWACDTSYLVSRGNFAGVMAIQLIQPAIYVPAVLALWMTDAASLASVLASFLGGTLAAFFLALWLTRSSRGGAHVSTPQLIRDGFRFSGAGVAEAAASRLDQALALPVIGATGAGIYSVAATVASAPQAIAQAMSAATFPEINRLDHPARRDAQIRSIRLTAAIAITACPALALVAWPLIPIAFGTAFRDSQTAMLILLPGSAMLMIAYLASMALASDGLGYRMTANQLVGLAGGTVLLLVLGPLWGSIGAATASTIGYCLLFACAMWSLRLNPIHIIPRARDVRSAWSVLLKRA